MEYSSLVINVIAIVFGLCIYIGIVNSKWGKEHAEYQYGIMLAAIMAAVLIGGLIRWLI